MVGYIFRILFLAIICISLPQNGWSKSNQSEEHVFVAMRSVGHRLLLASEDSTSRVLPIEKVEGRYKIEFESTFSFDPELLTSIVDSVVEVSRIASSYNVEVLDCDSELVVYSYEMDKENQGILVACKGDSTRTSPLSCGASSAVRQG